MDQTNAAGLDRTIGERIVAAAWDAVAAHLATADATIPDDDTAAGQVATGGAGANDGVTDDALPARLRDRLR